MAFRVTQNLLNDTVMQNLHRNTESLLKIQSRLSSGKRLTRPSDDPVDTASAIRLRARLSETKQLLRNIDRGETQLNYADNVFDDMNGLLMRAQDLAIAQANVTADADTREAVAHEIHALIDQFVDLLNTRIGNRYIFGGFESLDKPFLQTGEGITYLGDSGKMNIEIEGGTTLNANIPGSLLLPTAVNDLGGHSNLHASSEKTMPVGSRKLRDLNFGTGVDKGWILIINRGGKTARVDLRNVETLDDVVVRINMTTTDDGRSTRIRARVDEDTQGLVIEDDVTLQDRITGQNLTVQDVTGGRIARQLGIEGENESGSGVIQGRNLAPLELTTRLADLHHGTGVELGRFQITDRAGNSAVVDISRAETLADVRQLINEASTNIRALINTGGNGILIQDISPVYSTGSIKISELGENTHTARDLGILTPANGAAGTQIIGGALNPGITMDTQVSLLNRGQGFDLKTLMVENGSRTGSIDLSRASTVGAVIQTINESGLELKARINDLGTGISVTSITGGRTLKITSRGAQGSGDFTASLLGIEGSRNVLVDPVKPLGNNCDLLPAIDGETRLADLNQGQGVAPGLIRITDALGGSINISLEGANTIQGILNLINHYGADGNGMVNVSASISNDMKSITVTDRSIQNTVIQRVQFTGNLTSDFNSLSAGEAVVVNTFSSGAGKLYARNMDIVSTPLTGESSMAGNIESIDKEKGEIALRASDGELYYVRSQQPVDNLFIGQSIYLNGTFTPEGEFVARTVELVTDLQGSDQQFAGTVESVDRENSTITLLGTDGATRRTINIVDQAGLLRIEDIGGGTAAAGLGILGESIVGSDRIEGTGLDPLISGNTKLSLLGGATFIPGRIAISNGNREAVMDFSTADTVGDMLAIFNASTVGVAASNNDSGTGICLRSSISGTTLMVNKIAEKNPDGTNKVYPDNTTVFDETADKLGLTGSADVLGNLLFLEQALMNNNQEDVSRTLDNFPEALNRILNQRTKAGARVNQLTTTSNRGQDSSLRNTEILTGIEDLDVIEAISDLAAQENAFNAALSSASKVILPSLLDYL